ncbi:MAG TPA: non-ribosomal peptide synthetase [Candidatus Acidoferrales bacterium]
MANPAQTGNSESELWRPAFKNAEWRRTIWSDDSAASQNTFIPQLFSTEAEATPQALAIAAGTDSLTYQELNSRANRLAHYLQNWGVGPEEVVGLCLERSLEFVVAALGVLKAGGAYLPLDAAAPTPRVASLLADSQASVLITTRTIASRLPAGPWRVLAIDADSTAIAQCPSHSPAIELEPENLAYVIYTSGSSGEPKGVEITHRSLSNLVSWHRSAFGVTSSDRATQMASPGFDAAVWELWPYLAAGASVHLADKLTIVAPAELRDWLVSQGITIGFVPTALAEQLITLDWPASGALRFLLTGADALRHYPPRNLPFALVNNYGPTECTVVATSGIVSPVSCPDSAPPIGRAVANTQIYILDKNREKVSTQVAGELYIAGMGLARGYRNRPDLTAERFIPNPFSSQRGSRMYRTGDRACYLPDGQIAFLGRVDDQIKILGYRIEPNEIESALDKHPAVQVSVVVAREDAPGEKRLIAYVCLVPDLHVTAGELSSFVAKSLPAYMVPSGFVRVRSFLPTVNGKIDRSALPAPDATNTLQDRIIISPRTLVEEQLSGILCRLLHLDSLSMEDNFFMLGGHSLLGTQLIARIRDVFGVEITLRVMFDNATVAGISAEIERLILAKLDSEAYATGESASDAYAREN